jgi:7-keto-8-aminopelargonate synthetase-like enzyme
MLGPILPIPFADADRAQMAARHLRALGILTQPIRPPTVPSGARLRVTVSAAMTRDDISRLGDALVDACDGSSF